MKKRKIYQQANPSGNESSGFFEVNEEQVLYNLKDSSMLPILTEQFISFLEEDGRVKQAWLFGSVLSDSFHKTSDIDLMVEFNSENEYSISLISHTNWDKLLEEKLILLKKDSWKTLQYKMRFL